MTTTEDWADYDRDAARDAEFEEAGWSPGLFDTTLVDPERGEVKIPVYGYRRDGLGIHPGAGGWNLTALGNGYRIAQLPTAEAARACAEEIADLADWSGITAAEVNTRGPGFQSAVASAVQRAVTVGAVVPAD